MRSTLTDAAACSEQSEKSDDGSVKVLNGGVEEDINVYLGKLKNPGSGYEHHFKPSAQAGMGAKPTTGTAGAAGIANPWLEGSINLTRQMALEATDLTLQLCSSERPVNSPRGTPPQVRDLNPANLNPE